MSWQQELTIITRHWINDFSDPPTYSDERIEQLLTIAAQYVVAEVNLDTNYTIDINSPNITPDPTNPENKDVVFITLVGLKASCMLDQSSLRTKAAMEGVRAALGPASLSVSGGSQAYKYILDVGPCALYNQLKMEYEIGNSSIFRAILSPFVGNNFDPSYLRSYSDPRGRSFYS
jgi:hypothetical protein